MKPSDIGGPRPLPQTSSTTSATPVPQSGAQTSLLDAKSGTGLIDKVKKVGNQIRQVDDFVHDKVNDAKQAVKHTVNEVKAEAKHLFDEGKQVVNHTVNEVKTEAKHLFDEGKQTVSHVVDRAKQLEHILESPSVNDVKRLVGLDDDQVKRDKLVKDTAELRTLGGNASKLEAELKTLPKNSPRYQEVSKQLAAAKTELATKYGYTNGNAPKPGSLWVDPQFMGKELSNGKVTSQHFPVGKAVTQPPSPTEALFAGGQQLHLVDGSGKEITLKNAAEYRAFVQKNRQASGMPRTDGEPVGVHVSFEGGGGKGKRYGAALTEMFSQGVVPTSVSGSSAGAIAASMVAAGADPVELQKIVTDPALKKMYDVDLAHMDGGALDGNKAYDFIDQKLRELTGIKDRPVTFADLKVPLQVLSTKMSDSQWPPGSDPTKVKDRVFVFSQETTPDTPVALAVRASMAIPGVFDPVQVTDPMTGRTMQLVDGGTIDNLPIGYNKNNLPVIGLTLGEQADQHPASKTAQAKPLPSGNIDVGNIANNIRYGLKMNKDSAGGVDDWNNRTHPQPGQFMLTLPTWNLTNPEQGDSTMGFGWDSKVDPVMDQQGRQVTRNFLKSYLDDIGVPGRSGTNVSSTVPPNLQFQQDVRWRGKDYVATYTGGDSVKFVQKGGNHAFTAKIGQQKIEALYLDDQAFHDLGPKLGKAVDDQMGWWDKIKRGKFPIDINLPI